MAGSFLLGQGSSTGLPVTQNKTAEVSSGLAPLHSQQGFVGPRLPRRLDAGASLGSLSWSGLGTTHFRWVYKPGTLYVMGNRQVFKGNFTRLVWGLRTMRIELALLSLTFVREEPSKILTITYALITK